MVIGYDAKAMLESEGGMGHYGRIAVEALTEHESQNEYMLYTPTYTLGSPLINKLLTRANIHVKTSHKSMFTERWRTGSGILHDCHRHRVKVFHGINGELPKGIERDSRMAAVVSMPPLTFKHFSQGLSFFERRALNSNVKRLCQVAARIIVMSEFAKQELLSLYDVEPGKVEVVYPCCEFHFHEQPSPDVVAALERKYDLPQRFILVSGEYDERHNLETAIRAISAIDREVHIVFVGHRSRYWERLKALAESEGVMHRIKRIPKVHEADMSIVYQKAEAVVCPSRYECASMTIIRALTCGVPIVAATGSCMEEYGGKAALYFSPSSPEALAEAVAEAMGPQRAALLAHAQEQVKKFSSATLATTLNRIYHEVAPQKKP